MKTIKLFQIAAFALLSNFVMAQAAWIEPDPTSANFNPDLEIKIYVDAKKTECPDLAQFDEVYMWTWSPRELPAGNEKHNGTWSESNDVLKMTAEGDGVFSYTMIPTEFYEVDAATVYENDFSLLIKLKDGAGGATTCNEDKSEDLEVLSEPFVLERKVYSFPDAIKDTLAGTPSDFFTLIYNHNLEEKEGLVDQDDFYVFLKAVGDDARTYTYAQPAQLANFPELQMKRGDNGVFNWTIQPDKIFSSLLTDGVKIDLLRIQIAKAGARNGNDLVDGTFDFIYRCN